MPKHLNYDEPVLRYHRIVAELAAELLPRGGSVVDLGCGPGQILAELARRRPDAKLYGVDGDSECLRRAADRAPGATLVQDDICRPAILTERRFDVIVSSHALEHLPGPAAILDRWAQALTPNGRLVVAVPNSHQPIFLARALVRRGQVNEGHFYAWDRATFENFCRLAGFAVDRWVEDYVPLVPVRIREKLPAIAGIERLLLRIVPAFANSHIVVLDPATRPTDIGDDGSDHEGTASNAPDRSAVGGQHVGQKATGVAG